LCSGCVTPYDGAVAEVRLAVIIYEPMPTTGAKFHKKQVPGERCRLKSFYAERAAPETGDRTTDVCSMRDVLGFPFPAPLILFGIHYMYYIALKRWWPKQGGHVSSRLPAS